MRSYCVLLMLVMATLGFADTVYMKDGRTVTGTYLGGTARQVRIEVGDRVESYDISDVTKIEFQSSAAGWKAAAPAPTPAPPQERERVRLTRPDATPEPPPSPAASASATIPAGTVLKV